MRPRRIADLTGVQDLQPFGFRVGGVDLVLIRNGDEVSVLYGRCLHRGALMQDGSIVGDDIICGVHGWDFNWRSGVSAYNNAEALARFKAWIEDGGVYVDVDEVAAWEERHPQPFRRDEYLGQYADTHPFPGEDRNQEIRALARHGLKRWGHHGPTVAMGVPRTKLPSWDDIQVLTGQLATLPLLDDAEVATGLVIGPRARRPLALEIPLFVSDMSFGALSEEAKVSLARGAEMAGTGICSGEGGMLPEEHAENRRYFYELASGGFGFSEDKLKKVQAFHFKCGQGAKTGTGGHLPGSKVIGKIAEVRGLEPGTASVSPSRFAELATADDFRQFGDRVRELTGGIPIGFKLSAQHIEEDIDFALEAGADYIILDGRGGGTGAAPTIFRDHISVPTMPALARARRHLDRSDAGDVTLIVTGGLRTAPDFVKAMALGADGVAVANSAMQAIGCIAMRACNTDNCPVGIATQKENLRARLEIARSAVQLKNFFEGTVDLMKVLARACGHDNLGRFNLDDLSTFDRVVSELTGIRFAGVSG